MIFNTIATIKTTATQFSAKNILNQIRENLKNCRYLSKADTDAECQRSNRYITGIIAVVGNHLHAADYDRTEHHQGATAYCFSLITLPHV